MGELSFVSAVSSQHFTQFPARTEDWGFKTIRTAAKIQMGLKARVYELKSHNDKKKKITADTKTVQA